MAKLLKLYATYTFSTSPNLCHHTTMLNTDVPNCYMTHWNLLFVRQYLMTELLHSKLKYEKAVSSTTYRLNIVRIYARNVPRVHGHKHADDGATSQ